MSSRVHVSTKQTNMQRHLLTNANYLEILKKLYKTTEVEFLGAKFEQISEDVEGFLGEHNSITVTFKLGDVTTTEFLFIKAKPQNNKFQIKVADEFDAYGKEIFLYDTLIPQFEKYGCDVDFAPKCLFVVPEKALIFENLRHKGFKLSDRHAGFTMAQIKCALRALSKYHGAGIIYNLKKTIELKRDYSLTDDFGGFFEERLFTMAAAEPSEFAGKYWKGALKTIRTIINLLPGDETYKNKFISMVSQQKYGEVFVQPSRFLKTCGHGDLWSNNMMFKYEDGVPVDCRLLDFQICRYFYPAYDVILLIFGNTTPSFRADNLQTLFKYYYEVLGDLLVKQGYQLCDLMAFGDFLEMVKYVQGDAMLQVTSAQACTHLPKELLNTFTQVGNADKLEDFFFDNANLAEEAFKTNDHYRNILTRLFQEYYDILLTFE